MKTFLFYRVSAGLTQQEIADKLGLKKENVSAWERGKKNIPKKHCDALAALLHISTEDILRINAIRKSEFRKDDAYLIRFAQTMIRKVSQQDWTKKEKTKFSEFIEEYTTRIRTGIK